MITSWGPGFNPRPGHLGFVMDKVPLGQVFLQVLQVPSLSTIPPMFYKHSICYQHYVIVATGSTVKQHTLNKERVTFLKYEKIQF
jgi:hypothetical protein